MSTHLSEHVKIGGPVLILLAWNSPELPGCCWHPLPLLHNDITELLDVRNMVLLHLPLENAHMCSIEISSGDILGHSITFTFSSKGSCHLGSVFGVDMLEQQFSEWRASSSASECQQYMLESMFLLMNRSSPAPAVVMQPLVSRSQTFRLTAESLEKMAAFIGQGLPTRPFDPHVKTTNHI